ncbi:hypothetical protein WBP06_03200 [Novosphingobium sp. BL-8H]|uniref:hypothetical protein n=1 Tax=Novosphingobium sp. BL-8H TaxID=3127640 RepID=UPI003757F497
MPELITGWKLPAEERDRLLARFPPRYICLVADHVTLRFGTDDETPLPTQRTALVVGEADDGRGVQALVVEIAGTTHRGDGSHFHITWTLAQGRVARESNELLKAGWLEMHPPIAIDVYPARWNR